MSHTRFAIALITLPALGLGQSRAELEEQRHLEALFAEQMSGCKMTGRFTVDGDDSAPQADSYTLGEVKKSATRSGVSRPRSNTATSPRRCR